ncbi:unnamed protein product [Bursaphelenchus xylophilus]|uniref:(pine wood nematode) hypothetical protein n=1 Tax=Bursaphelenchus xylophilus TaxID=6326 RepID=A0A1I7RIW7_BURXY|nr:unnamed protein product [Bursaphelenchus xylophilus]CAG9119142.1 unnamed protein product [Bursaphelenchus xylophilus]
MLRVFISVLLVVGTAGSEVVPAVEAHRAFGFLDGADSSFKKTYNDLLMQHDIPKKDLQKKIDEFVGTLPKENQEMYKTFREFVEKRQKELDRQHDLRHATLAARVQEMDDKVTALYKDQNLTTMEECVQIAALWPQYTIVDQLQIPAVIPCEKYKYRMNY